jgi:hypothetical protein
VFSTELEVPHRTIFQSLTPLKMYTLVQVDETEEKNRVVRGGKFFSVCRITTTVKCFG